MLRPFLVSYFLFLLQLQFGSGFVPFQWETFSDDSPESFNWSSTASLSKLRYTDCYDGFECARYELPLDWTDRSNPNKVVLAVARLPAKVDESDPSFGGTIVLNPGGPSGSGVDLLRWAGRGIQEIVDGDKHFEILSFDPRGTKYTTPSTACFDDAADRDLYVVQNTVVGSVADSDFSLNVKWSYSQGLGALCEYSSLGSYPDGTNIRQYVSTALVAHDMVELTDAIDEHRRHALSKMEDQQRAQQVLNEERSVPLLNYWGYSYGTYLGNTFASMFPDRIGRMILDGVVDAPDYAAAGWSTNLNDNDKVWVKFFEWCFDAGSKCALNDKSVQRPSDIATRLDEFIDEVIENPLPIVYNDNVAVFTYYALEALLHYTSYGPHQTWPILATALANLFQTGPGTPHTLEADQFHLLTKAHPHSSHSPVPLHLPLPYQEISAFDPFNNNTTPFPPGYPHSLEASISILCGDGDDITQHTKTNYTSYLSQLEHQSRMIGPVWAQITLWCRHWPASQRPHEGNRFTGPWSTRLSQYHNNASTTGWARPLLFIGNTADPVTPLRNALKMASQHEGARVLVQDAPGHCSGTNIPSRCTWDVIRRFFNDGDLPEKGKVCAVDWKPWDKL